MKLRVISLVFVLIVTPIVGCGKSDKKVSTQVAAKVNGDEISVHQVNYALQRLGNVPENQAKAASSQLLDKLIDEQLLIQKAIDQKLDREPRVVQTIEATKRQILAQAYLEKTMAQAAKSSDVEIKEFYAKRPDLFGERRMYRFNEVSFRAPPEFLTKLDAQVKASKSITEVTSWLGQEKIQFNVSSATKAAEQLPLDVLPSLHKMKDGGMEIVVNQNKTNYLVIQLAASQNAPLDEKAAQPYIEQFLQNRKRGEVAENELKQLRAAAKIEYQGSFVKVAAAEGAPTSPAPVNVAQPITDDGTPKAATTDDKDFMNKGLSGLK